MPPLGIPGEREGERERDLKCKYEVTSWLQIQAVRLTDEGTYHCYARNSVGQVAAPASLMVLTPGK
ncbi:Kazal-type serine protease inhibitor domain-containing protein 1, partial [Ophiophagus hannah]